MGIKVLDEKQPYEEYYIKFDFTNVIGTAEISSSVVSAIDSSGADATTTVTKDASKVNETPYVNVWVQGGVTGERYTITCKIVTNSGEKYELEAELPVVEITKY